MHAHSHSRMHPPTKAHASMLAHLSLTSHVHVTCYYTWHTQNVLTHRRREWKSVVTLTSCYLLFDTPVYQMRHRVPMSTWYDQLVGTALWPLLGTNMSLHFVSWIWILMGVLIVTGCLSLQDCWTALISAAKEGHIDVVRELLENNANLEHRDMVRIWKKVVAFGGNT